MKATTRENLLCTMALYAGEMVASDVLRFLSGNDGEDELADYCSECVDEYMSNPEYNDVPFCEFAEEKLLEKFQSADGDPMDDPEYRPNPTHKVIAVAGSVEKDLGIEGTYEECHHWCEYYDWVYRPDGDGGFEWDLWIEEV